MSSGHRARQPHDLGACDRCAGVGRDEPSKRARIERRRPGCDRGGMQGTAGKRVKMKLCLIISRGRLWAAHHHRSACLCLCLAEGAGPLDADNDGADAADGPGAGLWWAADEIDMNALSTATEAAAASGASAPPTLWKEWSPNAYLQRWRFVVGLVGKPSAGKSTFFNAACHPTDPEAVARMAAHPFTTIEPNFGFAFFAGPCPCAALGLQAQCAPEHGKPAFGRRVPVVVKDVAGLVPGAYQARASLRLRWRSSSTHNSQIRHHCSALVSSALSSPVSRLIHQASAIPSLTQGRGKGNAFLNDLVDADVLIHVVDASGTTDKEGQASGPGTGDPVADVSWVRGELHCWIFSNVRSKFGRLQKRAAMWPDPDAVCDVRGPGRFVFSPQQQPLSIASAWSLF